MKKIVLMSVIASVLGTPTSFADTAEVDLGAKLYSDENLSLNRNQSCASCHTLEPVSTKGKGKKHQSHRGHRANRDHRSNRGGVKQQAASFIDPDNIINGTPVSAGSVEGATGGLNAPSAGYAAFSPAFHYDEEEGLYFGGQFWDGRAPKLNDQAKGPFLNPVEMAMPDKASVIERLKEDSDYKDMFFGAYAININDGSSSTDEIYDKLALAIEAFERTSTFNRFDGKFDYVENGWIDYTPSEERGADLFDSVCANCHEGTREDDDGNLIQGVMTDFSYDNIGVPANPDIVNPDPGHGLGNNPAVIADGRSIDEHGKQKVMSLRNIELTPPYMHNGVFPTLEMVVHFYNTRDVLPKCEDIRKPKMGKNCWPAPEVAENVNTDEVGDMGLSRQDEIDIVNYLKTFTDGYTEPGLPEEPGYLYTISEIMPPR